MTSHRIGLIGCGWIAPFHVVGLAKSSTQHRIVWVADPHPDHAETLAAQTGARPIADYREGLAEIDCAFVLVPHHLHHSITLDCLNAGCHVLLEKPMANSLAEADEMIATAERVGKTLMVAYPHRYRKGLRLFKEVIESGRYGKLLMLDGVLDETVDGYYLAPWLIKRETLGGGVLFSSSGHLLDIMLWIGGEVQSASMVGTRGCLPMEGEDTAACVIKFKNGIIGVASDTWASPKVRTWYTMRAMCEKAHLILTTTDLGNQNTEGANCAWVTRIKAVGKCEEVLYESGEGLDLAPEIDHFFSCVDTGRRPHTDGVLGRKIMALVFDMYRKADAEGANV
jgi:predicted dehydrogenase